MVKKFADLIAHRALESQARVEALHQKLRAQMLCRELRHAQALSQDTLTKAPHVNQAAI